MECHICKAVSEVIFKADVLSKYDVSYYKCINCGFIQTEKPYWLPEAYTEAISLLDVGLVERNINLCKITSLILQTYFDYTGKFVDYAGGYGLFVRLMRDKGFDFYRQDIYCENIFSKCFDYSDLTQSLRFELLTAFEVFEHLVTPLSDIQSMFEYSDNILFSTELQPEKEIKSVKDWHYFIPETGQHVAFYSYRALEIIAEQNQKYLYSNNQNLHLFTSRKLPSNPFVARNILFRNLKHKVNKLLTPSRKSAYLQSWRQRDYNFVLNKFYTRK